MRRVLIAALIAAASACGLEFVPMAEPTIIDTSSPEDLSGTTDSRVGFDFITFGTDEDDSPSHAAKLYDERYKANTLLRTAIGGAVVQEGALTIGAYSLASYEIGGTYYAFAGATGQVLAANQSHKIYLDTAGTLQTTTGAWPASAWRLAIVTTGATAITDIVDHRFANVLVNSSQTWYNTAAAAHVDMGGYGFGDCAFVALSDAATVQISTGTATVTQSVNYLQSETGVTDDLDGIVLSGTELTDGDCFVMIRALTGHTITLKHGTGDLYLKGDTDYDLTDDADDWVLLFYSAADGEFYEFARSKDYTPAQLSQSLDVNDFDLVNVGQLNFKYEELTIASGVITVASGNTLVNLLNEGAAASDDLDTINGGADGDVVILRFGTAPQVPTVKHATGNISLASSDDFDLSSAFSLVALVYRSSVSYWMELFRLPLSLENYVALAEKCLPGTFVSGPWGTNGMDGALASGVKVWHVKTQYAIYVTDIDCEVATAPSGGVCTVKLLDDGVSIGSAAIADGTTAATGTINATVAAGSILKVEIDSAGGSPNSADDLTVAIHYKQALQAAP